MTVQVNSAGETVVVDETLGNIWYWDLGAFAGQNYSQQLSAIEQLNLDTYFGSSTWHLATGEEMQTLFGLSTSTIRQTFAPSHERYDGSFEWHYWSGRYEQSSGELLHNGAQTAWGNFFFGPFDYAWPEVINLSDAGNYIESGAWVVSSQAPSGGPEQVPEQPLTVALLVPSLVIMFITARTGFGRKESLAKANPSGI